MLAIHASSIHQECPHKISSAFSRKIELLFNQQYQQQLNIGEGIVIEGIYGLNTACLNAKIGSVDAFHLFQVFAPFKETLPHEDMFAWLVDYLDGAIAEFFEEDRCAFFPLDFSKRNFEKITLWVRHEFHNIKLEKMADQILVP